MPDKFKHKFGIKFGKDEWWWHIGINICIAPEDVTGHRERYLYICFGHHNVSIGFLTDYLGDEE